MNTEYKYYILKNNALPSWRDEVWRCKGDKHWVWHYDKFYWHEFPKARYYEKDFYKEDISEAVAKMLTI